MAVLVECARSHTHGHHVRDGPCAQRPDGGGEWLLLAYDPPVRAFGLRVHEVLSPGAVARVTLIDEAGVAHVAWEGVDPTTKPGVFQLDFPATDYAVRQVRLDLDTSRRKGWNEIDAVGLVGQAGISWAKTASASSYYGAGGGSSERSFFDGF